MPIRICKNNTVISDDLPRTTINISDDYQYLGTEVFQLSEYVEVEIFVFIITEGNKVVQRLVIHFERLIKEPESPYHMRIPTPLTETIGDQDFYTDIRCTPSHFFQDYEDSTDDWANVYRMMKAQGYEPPIFKSHILIKRLGQIVADDGSAEFLIIYTEPFDNENLDASPNNTYLVTDRERHLIADFEQRALNSFSLIEAT